MVLSVAPSVKSFSRSHCLVCPSKAEVRVMGILLVHPQPCIRGAPESHVPGALQDAPDLSLSNSAALVFPGLCPLWRKHWGLHLLRSQLGTDTISAKAAATSEAAIRALRAPVKALLCHVIPPRHWSNGAVPHVSQGQVEAGSLFSSLTYVHEAGDNWLQRTLLPALTAAKCIHTDFLLFCA